MSKRPAPVPEGNLYLLTELESAPSVEEAYAMLKSCRPTTREIKPFWWKLLKAIAVFLFVVIPNLMLLLLMLVFAVTKNKNTLLALIFFLIICLLIDAIAIAVHKANAHPAESASSSWQPDIDRGEGSIKLVKIKSILPSEKSETGLTISLSRKENYEWSGSKDEFQRLRRSDAREAALLSEGDRVLAVFLLTGGEETDPAAASAPDPDKGSGISS